MSTASPTLAVPRTGIAAVVRDYAELTKVRVTSLIVITAWCGYYFGAQKAAIPAFSWNLLEALLGIGLVSAGSAALNEVIERDVDGRMRRTAGRPLPSGRMSLSHGLAVGIALTLGGALFLAFTANMLTAWLSLATSAVYLGAYTPLKRIHPLCTLVGAFPGAMPGLLGWTAARGRLDLEAFVLFAIVFFWQFPHFLSIAWLYREDYESGGIRMLPVVDPDGKSTAHKILLYSFALIPVTLIPTFLRLSGIIYLAGALLLGLGLLYFGLRLANLELPMGAPRSKQKARQLLQASVIYLPLLFALMMLDKIPA